MKITLEISDRHSAEIVNLLARLMREPEHQTEDQAEGHPELPLNEEEVIVLEVFDKTRRDLPFPDDCPPLPPLPEYRNRWVCRGKGFNPSVKAEGRVVYYRSAYNRWIPTDHFSCDRLVHIEAI